MEVLAAASYTAQSSEELSFKKDEKLKILDFSADWYWAEKGGNTGLVPKNFLNIPLDTSWYIGDGDRNEACSRLHGKHNGAFVVRNSRHPKLGLTFTLCVKWNSKVQYYKIVIEKGNYFIWVQKKFPSINELVKYYSANSVTNNSTIILSTEPPVEPPSIQRTLPRRNTNNVKALYSFNGSDSTQLTFNKDDHILVTEKLDANWWKGELLRTGQYGLFPATYVDML